MSSDYNDDVFVGQNESDTRQKPKQSRLIGTLIAFTGGIVLLGIVGWLIIGGDRDGATTAIGGPFSLIAQDGRTVTADALLGGPSLVFFGYTHCPDVCPTALYEIGQIYSALGDKGDRLKAFFITVDPERDTPDILKAYLASFDPRIVALSGTPDAVQAVMRGYRAFAKKTPLSDGGYAMDHTALVYLMDGKGRFVSSINFDRPPQENTALIARYF